MCVCLESDQGPLSYQDSVLPLNYTRKDFHIQTNNHIQEFTILKLSTAHICAYIYTRFNIAKTWKCCNYLLLYSRINVGFSLYIMDKNNLEKPWWRDGVIIFAKVSSYIAVPVILASCAGKFFDEKYNTGHLMFYTLIGLAFILTIFLIWKELKNYKKKLEREERKKKE